ncbi:hypothetical protein Dimus_006551 [Dionaea muscipula]
MNQALNHEGTKDGCEIHWRIQTGPNIRSELQDLDGMFACMEEFVEEEDEIDPVMKEKIHREVADFS